MSRLDSLVEFAEKSVQSVLKIGADEAVSFVQDIRTRCLDHLKSSPQSLTKETHDSGIALVAKRQGLTGEVSVPIEAVEKRGFEWLAGWALGSLWCPRDILGTPTSDEAPRTPRDNPSFSSLSVEKLSESLKCLGLEMGLSDRVLSAQIQSHCEELAICRSDGMIWRDAGEYLEASVMVESAHGGVGYAEVGSRIPHEIDFPALAREALQQAEIDARERSITAAIRQKAQEAPIIWDSRAVSALLSYIVVPALLGRNDLLSRKIGERIMGEEININDEPLKGLNLHYFDDRGLALMAKSIVDHGVLRGLLGDRLFRAVSFADYPRSFRNPLVENPTNLAMEQDPKGPISVLGEFPTSLLIQDIIGFHGTIPSRGDFSVRSSSAFVVESGELAFPIRDVHLKGNVYSLLREPLAVASSARASQSFGGLSFVVSAPAIVTPKDSVRLV